MAVWLYALLCFSAYTSASEDPYSYTLDRGTGSLLKLHQVPATLKEARLRCLFEGAELMSPISKVTRAAMQEMMKSSPGLVVMVHAGFQPAPIVNEYETADGSLLSKVDYKWAWDTNKLEDWREIPDVLAMSIDGSFKPISQYRYLPYICEMKKKEKPITSNPIKSNQICDTNDSGYVFDNRTGSCYKLHTQMKIWPAALAACVQEKANLVVINSEEEAQVIRDILARNPNYPAPNGKTAVFMGMMYETGEWKTIDGEKLSKAGYNKFYPGEPNNLRKREYCGSVNTKGLLFDDPCMEAMSFICEKKVDLNSNSVQ